MLFNAKVIHGAGRGHGLGFPTINLALESFLNWEPGVYAVRVTILSGDFEGECYGGAMNYGPRPTFNEASLHAEVHLLDFKGDLYGAKVQVKQVAKIRDVLAFVSKEALVDQIQKDIQQLRDTLSS